MGAFFALAAASIVLGRLGDTSPAAVSDIVAEPVGMGSRLGPLAPSPAPSHSAAGTGEPAPATDNGGRPSSPEAAPGRDANDEPLARPRLRHSARAVIADVRAPGEPASEERCRSFSQEGRTESAIECFRELGAATSLEGDIALYEAARLSLFRSSEPQRTLTLVEEHQRRFPTSALRIEVRWLHVQALHRLGRSRDALARSEELLGSLRDSALSAEIHWLRARIHLENEHDCRSALSDLVALIGQPGKRGDEAEWRRAQCLDQLGMAKEAAAAYHRYLERPAPSNAARAEGRLVELEPGKEGAR